MVIHLNISEALQAVLSPVDEMQKVLLDYENRKTNEIFAYLESSYGKKHSIFGIADLTTKVKSLTKVYHERNMGVLPMVAGKDYKQDMNDEDLTEEVPLKVSQQLIKRLVSVRDRHKQALQSKGLEPSQEDKDFFA